MAVSLSRLGAKNNRQLISCRSFRNQIQFQRYGIASLVKAAADVAPLIQAPPETAAVIQGTVEAEATFPTRHHAQNASASTGLSQASQGLKPPTPKKSKGSAKSGAWELTVGIEIHAQLNTDRKLFSDALTAPTDVPNSTVAPFDLALPGAQPKLQHAVLIPALRAALALNCSVQSESAFDRKHYFYHDQPAGYQITQYYAPFARDGFVRLFPHDGIASEDGAEVRVGIQQIQLEQDTAKTLQDPSGSTLLDFNRAGHALVEIITRPQIHRPQTAAACVRKIQRTLECVSAVTTGMELGGLRADVNVSVRQRTAGAGPLGQRTEIKNLSSFKAIESAVIAERDRQIRVLESGGCVEGETRGWSLGSTETRKLRGKEGEVDYRYMPDPDIPPLRIDASVVDYIRGNLPVLPDEQIQDLGEMYGIGPKDASILANLDDGRRLEYFYEVVGHLTKDRSEVSNEEVGRLAFNWTVHELGNLLTTFGSNFEAGQVAAHRMSTMLEYLLAKRISRDAARRILVMVFDGDQRQVHAIIEAEKLMLPTTSTFNYEEAIKILATENAKMAEKVRTGQKGIQQWFVGQLIRRGGKEVDPQTALKAVEQFFNS